MNYIGLSCGYHDAGVSVIDSVGNILFAGHSERYSKNKHDKDLHIDIITSARRAAELTTQFEVHYYEEPVLKTFRQLRAGQHTKFNDLFACKSIGAAAIKQLNAHYIHTHSHHLSHAAAGFQTSPFNEATVVIIDAIGEFDTISIWDATYDKNGRAKYKKLWALKYPDSIGLFYSAMTKLVGLRPLDEEYILMGMAAYGKATNLYDRIRRELIEDTSSTSFRHNLHIGVPDGFLLGENEMDIAAASQLLVEDLISTVMNKAQVLGKSANLVYGGGVALNCSANRLLGKWFDKIWVLPNPGDAGSSLGAACLGYGKKVNWNNAYLGHNIPGLYPVDALLNELLKKKIVGVASGRAEFGPRALGNRSLLADPRGADIKDTVNAIKRRQQFRPFAPVILEEYVHEYFKMPIGWDNSRYMQVISECKYPELFPAIAHADGTSRVQTVPKDGSGIRRLLEKWYAATGCPMLLNTSLNIRGEPMVNDRADATRFQNLYNLKVIS